MTAMHESGLFIHEGARVFLNKMPIGVRGYSIANKNGEIIYEQSLYSKYKFQPNDHMLVVNLDDGSKRIFRLNAQFIFEEVTCSYIVNEADLEGEDVLLYHLGLLDKKYPK